MARPTFTPNLDETFTFEVGRISGEGTFDLDEGTFTITVAEVSLPNGDTRALPHPEHFVDVPIPPPLLDFLI